MQEKYQKNIKIGKILLSGVILSGRKNTGQLKVQDVNTLANVKCCPGVILSSIKEKKSRQK